MKGRALAAAALVALVAGACAGGQPSDDGARPEEPVAGTPAVPPTADRDRPLLVTPVAGAEDPRPVRPVAVALRAGAVGPVAVVRWWSGPAPCTVLAGVSVRRTGHTVRVVVREGAGDGSEPCPEYAQLKATRVPLGRLAPGRWQVVAGPVRERLLVAPPGAAG